MKEKTKFIWFYTIILFSIALILILVAGLTQQNYAEELATHENVAVGMQRSVTELSETNMKLNQEIGSLKKENQEQTPIPWEVKDPKPPVIRSGHMETRRTDNAPLA